MTDTISPWRRFPADPADWYSPEEIGRAREYQRPIRRANAVRATAEAALILAVTGMHVVPDLAGDVSNWVLRLLIAIAVLQAVDLVVSTPVQAWRELAYDKRWGFSNQTAGGFVSDVLKGIPLGIVVNLLLFAPLWAVIHWTDAWWVVGWVVFSAVVGLFAGVLVPVVVQPIFNKYEPLEEGELRDQILAAARQAGADISDVLVEDSSRRDTRPNAYVAGLGKVRRVVLFDNILRYPRPAIVSVVAHEIGHWKLRHLRKRLPVAFATYLVSFAVLKVVLESDAALDFAGVDSLRDPAAFPLFFLAFVTVTRLTSLAAAWLSRAHEREADLFSYDLLGSPDELRVFFHDVSRESLADLAPSWWRRISHSHPPFAERMAMADAWARARSPQRG